MYRQATVRARVLVAARSSEPGALFLPSATGGPAAAAELKLLKLAYTLGALGTGCLGRYPYMAARKGTRLLRSFSIPCYYFLSLLFLPPVFACLLVCSFARLLGARLSFVRLFHQLAAVLISQLGRQSREPVSGPSRSAPGEKAKPKRAGLPNNQCGWPLGLAPTDIAAPEKLPFVACLSSPGLMHEHRSCHDNASHFGRK